jgi:hypothetical protein
MFELGSLRRREHSVHSNQHQYPRNVALFIDCGETVDSPPCLFIVEHTGRQHFLNPILLRGDLTPKAKPPGQGLTINRVELFDLLRCQLNRAFDSSRSPPRLALCRPQVG